MPTQVPRCQGHTQGRTGVGRRARGQERAAAPLTRAWILVARRPAAWPLLPRSVAGSLSSGAACPGPRSRLRPRKHRHTRPAHQSPAGHRYTGPAAPRRAPRPPPPAAGSCCSPTPAAAGSRRQPPPAARRSRRLQPGLSQRSRRPQPAVSRRLACCKVRPAWRRRSRWWSRPLAARRSRRPPAAGSHRRAGCRRPAGCSQQRCQRRPWPSGRTQPRCSRRRAWCPWQLPGRSRPGHTRPVKVCGGGGGGY